MIGIMQIQISVSVYYIKTRVVGNAKDKIYNLNRQLHLNKTQTQLQLTNHINYPGYFLLLLVPLTIAGFYKPYIDQFPGFNQTLPPLFIYTLSTINICKSNHWFGLEATLNFGCYSAK